MARLAPIQRMGDDSTMRGNPDGPTVSDDKRTYRNSSRSHFSGSSGESPQEENRRESYGPDVVRDFPALARLRAAVTDSSPAKRDWSDYAIILGAILLAGAILTTLYSTLQINARANQIVANDSTRVRQSGDTVRRLEGKLDAHISELNAIGGKLDALLMMTTPVTLGPPVPPATRRKSPPSKVVAPTTTVRKPVTSSTVAPATTSPPSPSTTLPCQLALGNWCILR